jgi:pimeloyl-ACP methyl ester carboxylesterase
MNTLVAVHGSGAGGWYWDDVAPLIEKRGYDTAVVDRLPSIGSDPAGPGDLYADADHVRKIVDAVDGTVSLVAHCYGGMVITELADHPAVRHSVYVAGYWPERGQSAADLLGATLGEKAMEYFVMHDDGTFGFVDDLDVVRQALFADIDEERAREIHRRLLPQSAASGATPSTAPERTHPTTYVITERDQILPPAAQEAMAQRADHVVRLATSHTPMFSAPEELASIIINTLNGD